MRAAVVVLGDLGRSPRMLFHARALAAEHVDVDLVGTAGAALPSFIGGDARITVHTILDTSSRGHSARSRVGYLVAALVRGIRLLASLTALLVWRLPAPDVILVQNPPGAPTLAVAWLAARLRSARLVVDWHNTTSAMLAMRLGAAHVLVRAIGWYEGVFGRAANVNLFVSSHMKDALGARWRFGGIVFRDHPADTFAPSAGEARERVRADLIARFGRSAERKPALLISPTSWTADERLDLLLEALVAYNSAVEHDGDAGGLPPVLALITGSGPMKRAFEDRVSQTPLAHVTIRTAWLEADDYPRAMAAADVGMCLHTSASGLDLPMKIADMFGAGIPVCAFDYGPCLQEVVHPGVNGVLFTTAQDCCAQLAGLLRGFPQSSLSLRALTDGVRQFAKPTWGEAWMSEVRAAVLERLEQHRGPGPPI
jgi:beta-1,4-mannosyltransferase